MSRTGATYTQQYLRYFDKTSTEILNPIGAAINWYDDFLGEVIPTDDYIVSIVNSGTFAANVQAGGAGRLTTGVADDDDMDVCLPITFKPSMGIGMEARIALGDIAHTAFNVGFTDTATEAADLIPVTFATATVTTTATDAAVIFTDSDATSNVVRAIAVANDVDGTVLATTATPVDAAFHIYRVEIDQDCLASFFYDGTLIGTQAAAVTSTTLLCPFFALINREGAANTLDIDYFRAWQIKRA